MGTRPKLPRVTTGTLDPNGMSAWLNRHLSWQRAKHYSEHSLDNRDNTVRLFIEWCAARSLTRPEEITKPILERYQRHLFHFRQPKNGKPLSARAQQQRMLHVRMYFRWLTRQNVLLYNPASDIELPKTPRRLPKYVLSVEETERVLSQADVREPLGLRDRAIMETFYSTGIRRAELSQLAIHDLDEGRGTLAVREGKGKKDRMVPIGERAIAWVRKYLDEVRPELVLEPDDGVLFLTRMGEDFAPCSLSQIVRQYVNAAQLGKTGSCHLFRHTVATLMLENGADVRFIQQLLGHADLSTTQLYTQVSIRSLQRVHALTHPASQLKRAVADSSTPETSMEGLHVLYTSLAAPVCDEAAHDVGDVAAALHAVLDEEAKLEAGELDGR